MSFDWESAEPDFSSFEGRYTRQRKTETLKSISPEYSEDESAKSAALINSENRNLLITLAQARGKALSVDADSDSKGKGAPRLLSAGLIQKEYLVKCRKDQHLIGSIDDQEHLSSAAGKLFRCTTCGRHFKDEIVEEIYVLSEVGRQLLSSSRWMMVWVTEILGKSGVPTELISWNGSASDDEIDIMVDIHGTKIFFELKDRDFDLGDAYPFAFRVARYGGDYGVIVTTGKVAAEVKSFLKESPREFGNVAFRTIEGEKAIGDELPKVMNSLSQVNVRRLIYPVSEYSGFNLIPYVNAWMQRIADEYKEKVSVLATAV